MAAILQERWQVLLGLIVNDTSTWELAYVAGLWARIPCDPQMDLLPNTWQRRQTFCFLFPTGGFALFKSLGLSYGERPETPSSPSVLVYGGATSSGAMAVQLLKRAGYRSIAVCSQTNFKMVKSLGAAEAFDYHSPTCGKDLRAYTRDNLFYAIDCVSSSSSMNICDAALSSKRACRYLSLDPFSSRAASLRSEVQAEWILAFTMLGDVIALEGEFRREATPEDYEFGKDWQFKVTRLLSEGKLTPHPVKVMAGGLAGAKEGLDLVKKGQVSA